MKGIIILVFSLYSALIFSLPSTDLATCKSKPEDSAKHCEDKEESPLTTLSETSEEVNFSNFCFTEPEEFCKGLKKHSPTPGKGDLEKELIKTAKKHIIYNESSKSNWKKNIRQKVKSLAIAESVLHHDEEIKTQMNSEKVAQAFRNNCSFSHWRETVVESSKNRCSEENLRLMEQVYLGDRSRVGVFDKNLTKHYMQSRQPTDEKEFKAQTASNPKIYDIFSEILEQLDPTGEGKILNSIKLSGATLFDSFQENAKYCEVKGCKIKRSICRVVDGERKCKKVTDANKHELDLINNLNEKTFDVVVDDPIWKRFIFGDDQKFTEKHKALIGKITQKFANLKDMSKFRVSKSLTVAESAKKKNEVIAEILKDEEIKNALTKSLIKDTCGEFFNILEKRCTAVGKLDSVAMDNKDILRTVFANDKKNIDILKKLGVSGPKNDFLYCIAREQKMDGGSPSPSLIQPNRENQSIPELAQEGTPEIGGGSGGVTYGSLMRDFGAIRDQEREFNRQGKRKRRGQRRTIGIDDLVRDIDSATPMFSPIVSKDGFEGAQSIAEAFSNSDITPESFENKLSPWREIAAAQDLTVEEVNNTQILKGYDPEVPGSGMPLTNPDLQPEPQELAEEGTEQAEQDQSEELAQNNISTDPFTKSSEFEGGGSDSSSVFDTPSLPSMASDFTDEQDRLSDLASDFTDIPETKSLDNSDTNFVEKKDLATTEQSDNEENQTDKSIKEELAELIADNMDEKEEVEAVETSSPIVKASKPKVKKAKKRSSRRRVVISSAKKKKRKKRRKRAARVKPLSNRAKTFTGNRGISTVVNHVPVNLAKNDIVSMHLGKVIQSNQFPDGDRNHLKLLIKTAKSKDGLFDEELLKSLMINPDSFKDFRSKFLEIAKQEDKGQSIYHEIEEVIDGKVVKVKIIPLIIDGRFVYQKVYPKGVNTKNIAKKSKAKPSRKIASLDPSIANDLSLRYLDFISAGNDAIKD